MKKIIIFIILLFLPIAVFALFNKSQNQKLSAIIPKIDVNLESVKNNIISWKIKNKEICNEYRTTNTATSTINNCIATSSKEIVSYTYPSLTEKIPDTYKNLDEMTELRQADRQVYRKEKNEYVMKFYGQDRFIKKNDKWFDLQTSESDKEAFYNQALVSFGDTATSSTNNGDSYLNLALPNTNYGSDTTMQMQSYLANNRWRPIIKFTLPSGEGTITNVKLFLYTVSGGYICGASNGLINVHSITQSWTEAGVTWNKYDGTNNWASAGGDYSGTVIDQFTMRGGACTTGTAGWETAAELMGGGSDNPLSLNWGSTVDLMVKDSLETGADANYDYTNWTTKEYTTNTSLRPYLEITYIPPVVVSPGVDIMIFE